jgi:hypothetical protein
MTDAMRHAERLAAMLDGPIDEQERERLLELLAESEAALSAFADAAAVRAELEGAPADADTGEGVAPGLVAEADAAGSRSAAPDPSAPTSGRSADPSRRPGMLRSWRLPVALAAGLGAIALAAALIARGTLQPAADPGTYAALLVPRGAESVAWQGGGWSSTRAAEDPLTTETRAVRVGALLVALDLAVREDRPHAAGLARSAADLFAQVSGGGPVVSHYERIAELPAGEERIGMLAAGAAQATALLPAERVLAGAWLEAARVAVLERDADFFRARASRSALTRIQALSPLPPAAAVALARIDEALPADGGPDWAVLETELDAALRALAS